MHQVSFTIKENDVILSKQWSPVGQSVLSSIAVIGKFWNYKLTINSILTIITLLSKPPAQPLTSTLGFPIWKGKQWQPLSAPNFASSFIHCFMFRSEEHSPPLAGRTTMSLGRNRDTIGFPPGRTYQSISTRLWKVVTSRNWRWVESQTYLVLQDLFQQNHHEF